VPRLFFASRLRAVAPADGFAAEGANVGAALEAAFAAAPALRSYVLDEAGRVRKHVAIFVDGERGARETVLGQGLTPASEVYVMQALSGG
jgi:hypothetical protein